MIRTTLLLLALLPGLLGATSHAAPPKPRKAPPAKRAAKPLAASGPLYAQRPEVMAQADALATRMGLDPAWVRDAIGQARYLPSVAKAILPPPVGVPKNWNAYRERFVEPVRIQAGVRFWQAHRDSLQRAEAATGVPASLIVGILGVETLYGQNTGNFRVIDALSTLAFDFPAAHPKAATRQAFFLAELEQYLALTARTHTNPLALRGSYAGAMGWPQFMPSSWVQYAIDFDGDGRIDLFHSVDDIIGSVAHYFQAFNWRPGMPPHYPLHLDSARLDPGILQSPDILPSRSVADWAALGVVVDAPGTAHEGLLALIELQNGDEPALYVAGTDNFYAITRYNWSSYYAMAVIALGQAVKDALP